MFLAATGLEEFWDKSDELFFLGPWCAPFGREPEKGARFSFLEDPWRDVSARRAAYAECLAAYDYFLPALAERLNAFHGVKRSGRYWAILVGPWLTRYVQLMRDRYGLVRAAFAAHPGLRSWTLAPQSRVLVRDAYEFTTLACGDHYNLQLFSQAQEALGLPGEPRVLSWTRASAAPRRRLAARLAKGAQELARRAGARRIWLHELCLPEVVVWRLVAASRGAAWPFHPAPPEVSAPAAASPDRVRALGGLCARSEFEKVLAATLPANFPWLYFEGYAALAEQARAAGRARLIVSANGWSYDEGFKAAAAEQAERGARLAGVQHGGGYGMYECIWQEALERQAADAFWCWGWSGIDGDPRLRDVAAPGLDFRGAVPGGGGVLLASTDQSLYRHGFHSQPVGAGFATYLDDRDAFIAALPARARGRLVVRLQRGDLGWRQAERLKKRWPDVAVEQGGEAFSARARRAGLVVLDHPGTALLECAALGVPALCFWRDEEWAMRPAARPFIESLRRAGALFERPEEAAAAAGAAQDGAAWRENPEIVAAFEDVRAHFARSARDWPSQWSAALAAEEAKASG